jgi:hypothetical protein
LRGKYITAFFVCILIVLSLIQIFIDQRYEISHDYSSNAENSEYVIFIEIEDKTLYLLKDNVCIKKYTIASGKSGFPSPLGCWRITEKGDWGEGFGGRWMGLNVTWGKYGIHGTSYEESIGSAASHGCIRMLNEDVKKLYAIVPVGTEVVIVNGCFGPFGRGFYEINPGDRGADVMAIQKRLQQLGYYSGIIDGIYEDDLKYALIRFQEENGLNISNTITKKAHVACVSGDAFGMDGYIRFTFAIAKERLIEGLDRVENALKLLQ